MQMSCRAALSQPADRGAGVGGTAARTIFLIVLAIGLTACHRKPPAPRPAQAAAPCAADNGGLTLPPGFCAVVVADYFANLRGLAVTGRGDIYASLLNRRLNTGGLVGMRDNDGDGRAEEIVQFDSGGGVGLRVHGDFLYLGTDTSIVRYRLGEALKPAAAEVVVKQLPAVGLHLSKTFTFDDHGGLLVSIGSPSNACQENDLSPGSPGRDPCPELERGAGIWRFDANRLGQTFANGKIFAAGIRNGLAMDINPGDGELYVAQHGRDELSELWPQLYTSDQGSHLPAEELLRVPEGSTFSWPYCYFDPEQQRRVLAPEYGGDGMRAGRCAEFPAPVADFPAHYGPNDLLFYRAEQFPRRYRGGLFIAFHGAYHTVSGGMTGYQVVFVPVEKGVPGSNWEVFADGFASSARTPDAEPEHRPTALAQGADGSLYVADSVTGKIWRISYHSTKPPPAAVPPIPPAGSAAATLQNPGSTNG
ncbi:MAG: PQQ-dependent sugar dehydrogenase [Gammaproteobacteria bacterium]